MRLRTLLGDHPCTAALKDGSVKSDLVTLDFADYSPTNKGFKPMVREAAFDVSEMAIVTYLMAKSFGKPMVLLPSVVVARFQHAYALYNAELGNAEAGRSRTASASASAPSPPRPARGCAAFSPMITASISIRSTGSPSRMPMSPNSSDTTKRAPAGKEIIQMLLDGELDAVLGEKVDRPGLKPLFPDAAAEEKAWFAKHGVMPINHMVVVSETLSKDASGRGAGSVPAAAGERGAGAGRPRHRFSADEMRRSLRTDHPTIPRSRD